MEVRSDYDTTLPIQSKMNIFVLKSERIRSDSDRICTPLIPPLPLFEMVKFAYMFAVPAVTFYIIFCV